MRAVAETAVFQRYAAGIWSDAERTEFVSFIAANPTAGAVIGQRRLQEGAMVSFGPRQERRRASHLLPGGRRHLWLLIAYTKAKFDNLPTEFLAELKLGVEDAL